MQYGVGITTVRSHVAAPPSFYSAYVVALQAKNITLQQTLASIDLVSSFYRRPRTELAFKQFFDDTVTKARDLQTGTTELPRYRRPLDRIVSLISSVHPKSTIYKCTIRHVIY